MILFGLLWATSWIGSFLSLNQSLPPSITSAVDSTKLSANLGKLVSKPHPFFVQPKQPVKFWSTTLLPTRFLKIDWGDKTAKPTLNKSSNALKVRAKSSKNQFCSSLQVTEIRQPPVKSVSNLSAATFIEATSTQPAFLADKILRSLHNFFHFSTPFESLFSSSSGLPVGVVYRDESNYEVWVNNRLIANLPNRLQAILMQQRLRRLLQTPNLNALQLQPALVDGVPALMAGNRYLFGINKQITQKANRSGELLAIEWTNNLRTAMNAPTLSLVEGQLEMYGLKPSQKKMYGLASWYGPYFHGRLTANGEIFNQNELTVAHKSLPFNTFLKVTNLQTGKAVIVRVNDRGPYIPPRSLDLSRVAARCINSEVAGVVPYEAVIMQPSEAKITLKNLNLSLKNQKPSKKLAIVTDL
ncbi:MULTISPECIES: septal ring lytic transglycosylase RlpA family protein [Fischerella]|uniref:Probable endolytic peptidoglycan transglycosylase RlpA n=1 Tax=Fischerella muscicola CCMEE 5323 TaxID=2019572 RepID=A0A2N6K8U6_FISMU|nr:MULTISPECIES: septal ring lytic transglycosylase RlpA family protein [Fischerella]MBD2430703.1 septal ring lytic transglycosylase RlpA family protein [Fischerella sp. FACHB-380]PLZ94297.1 septal ring lytic transglycosylase RlpA family protein [Fischerella muscicola CCMEE 5323]